MPAPDGPKTLMDVMNRLSEANIELIDIGLRRPSLDEVFFALTKSDAERNSVVKIEFGKSKTPKRSPAERHVDEPAESRHERHDDVEISS